MQRDPFRITATCQVCRAQMTKAQVLEFGATCGPSCAERDRPRTARLGAWWVPAR